MEFAEYYEALYTRPEASEPRRPFPWQEKLAAQVIEHGWVANPNRPDAFDSLILDLPTASGKTTTLDIALFHLVHQLKTGVARTAPLRIFFIVDRRIVVDGTFRHARHLADKLADATDGPLKAAADLLRDRFEIQRDQRPLQVSIMRGGMYRDDGWTRSPVQPTICISTVDQVGSRLLFRGYGVSPSMRPVHAGLVANDSLLLIDEAHLSEPFLQTLTAVRRLTSEANTECGVQRPLQFVRMSATNAETDIEPFTIKDEDRKHPVLSRRLTASKTTTFVKVKVDKEDRLHADEQFTAETIKQALELAGMGDSMGTKSKGSKKVKECPDASEKPVCVIGIVVNRVRAARMICESFQEHFRPSDDQEPVADVLLLTGRIRPYDRDELIFRKDVHGKRGWLSWIAANREEAPPRPVFVVATQTVEVGADISFDAMVTEAAPLDCLRQRFGRLDRLGERQESAAVIVGRSDAVAKTAVDPVYGKGIGATWEWLHKLAKGKGKAKFVDFGLNAMETHLQSLSSAQLRDMLAPKQDAPYLQRPYAEIWSRTNPSPAADPEVASFLHGEESGLPDVQILWRADLLNHNDDAKGLQEKYENDYINTVALVPPTRMEVCSVPIWEAKNLLAPKRVKAERDWELMSDDLTDVEGTSSDDRAGRYRILALVWRGPERRDQDGEQKSHLADADGIRPGDTIVLPTIVGGSDEFGWNPTSQEAVVDVADCCVRWSRGRSLLRIHTEVLRQWEVASLPGSDDRGVVNEFLDQLGDAENLPLAVRKSIEDLAKSSYCVWYETDDESDDRTATSSFVLVGRKRLDVDQIIAESHAEEPDDAYDVPLEDDATSFLGQNHPVPLDDHTRGVKEHAGQFGRLAGLDHLTEDFELAALWHDLGKIDFRFQTMLHDGDEVEAILAISNGRLRAKSGMPHSDRAAHRRAKRKAGVPDNFRHEALSVMLLKSDAHPQILESASDADLAVRSIQFASTNLRRMSTSPGSRSRGK